MKQVIKKKYTYLISIITVIVFLFLWEISLNIFNISRAVLIKPTEILITAISEYDIILTELFYTAKEIILGWIIGNSLGFLVAIIIYQKQNNVCSRKSCKIFFLLSVTLRLLRFSNSPTRLSISISVSFDIFIS